MRIQYITHMMYKIYVNQPFILPVRPLANSRLLVVKIWGESKFICWFSHVWDIGAPIPTSPCCLRVSCTYWFFVLWQSCKLLRDRELSRCLLFFYQSLTSTRHIAQCLGNGCWWLAGQPAEPSHWASVDLNWVTLRHHIFLARKLKPCQPLSTSGQVLGNNWLMRTTISILKGPGDN